MDVVKVVSVGDAADGGRWFPGIHPHRMEQLRGGKEAEGEVKSPCCSMPLNMPLKMSH